jgi:hypothetical protein
MRHTPFGKRKVPGQIEIPTSRRPSMGRYLKGQGDSPLAPFSSGDVSIPFVNKMLVGLGLAAGGLAVFSAMTPEVPQACVDTNGTVVADSQCENASSFRSSSGSGYYPYRWHYGGSGYRIGSRPVGGSYDPPTSAVSLYRPNSPSTRGFLGRNGIRFGGGSWS